MTVHYTAVVQLEKVTTTEAEIDNYTRQIKTPATREVAEVARIVVRDTDLDRLTERVSQHIDLIEDRP